MQLDELPDDVLFEIASQLSLPDIVRLRQTSKHLRDVTLERLVWDRTYRTSLLIRPLGPFPNQSAKDLEDILVYSAKLDATWISSTTPSAVSKRILRMGLDRKFATSLLLGRWLLVGSSNLLRCYDLDAQGEWDEPVAQQSTEDRGYKSFQGLATTNSAGVRATYLVVCGHQHIRIYELHFPPTAEGNFKIILQEPLRASDNVSAVVDGDFLHLTFLDHNAGVLINLQTHNRYTTPEPRCPSDLQEMAYAQAVITRTHILIAYTKMGHGTWIEVIPLPDASQKDTLLPVSHTVRTPWFANIRLLCTTPSYFALLAMTSEDLQAPGFIELRLEENGSISVTALPSYRVGNIPTDIIGLHLTVGKGSTINARGIVVSRRGAQAIRMTSVAEAANITVKVEAGEKLLASGEDVQTFRTAFDGHRGRFIYRAHSLRQEEEGRVVIVDYA